MPVVMMLAGRSARTIHTEKGMDFTDPGIGTLLAHLGEEEKIKGAAAATAEAAKAKRDEYVREMSTQLDELNVKFEELKSRADKAEGEAKKDLEKRLEEAKVKRDLAAKKLDELRDAAPDRWEKVKDGVGSALDDLKKVFE